MFVIHTQKKRETELNLRYMLFLLFRKKKKKKKALRGEEKKGAKADSAVFFCLCWEICHHTPTYYLEWEKRVDARRFSHL